MDWSDVHCVGDAMADCLAYGRLWDIVCQIVIYVENCDIVWQIVIFCGKL